MSLIFIFSGNFKIETGLLTIFFMVSHILLRAITWPVTINTDLAWKSFILAQFSAEQLRGEWPTLETQNRAGHITNTP